MSAVTPRGFRDILPTEALARERITGTVRECFSRHGYLPVETPLIEDRNLLSLGGKLQDSPFQLFDGDGSLLMVRPDLTLPIARMVSARTSADDLPLRLRYAAPVVREESTLKGQPRQFTQLGVEYFGADGGGALPETEVVSLLAETLDALEAPAWRIVCGSVSPLKALLARRAPSSEFEERALRLAHESDLVSLDELVSSTELDPAVRSSRRLRTSSKKDVSPSTSRLRTPSTTIRASSSRATPRALPPRLLLAAAMMQYSRTSAGRTWRPAASPSPSSVCRRYWVSRARAAS